MTSKRILTGVFGLLVVQAVAQNYDVAAFVWPAYHPAARWAELGIFKDGRGEWQNLYESKKRYPDDYQGVKPLWGYANEADPTAVARKIDAAVVSGVNVFIYDWYWYGGRPFLEEALEQGFLKAPNRGKMRFYVMYANHNVNKLWDNRVGKAGKDELVWSAKITDADWRTIVGRWIAYFKEPNYYTIKGCPVVMIYDIGGFIRWEGKPKALERIAYLREETKKAGFPGLHLQTLGTAYFADDPFYGKDDDVGADSMTIYNWRVHTADRLEAKDKPELTYAQWGEMSLAAMDGAKAAAAKRNAAYFPNLSVGWDTNSRYPNDERRNIVHGSNPADFERFARAVRDWADCNIPDGLPKLITVNSWNEWTEGSYLEPDDLFGYGYLNALWRVFKGGSGELDAPVWPDVTPECLDAEATPACSMRGAYFKGGVVSAADDDGTLKKTYRLRRKFTLKAKPTAAWLQGICDGADQVVLNGMPLRFSRYIFEPLLENRTTLHVVTDKLREGENEIVADYTVNRLARGGCNKLPAGVLLELFVRLQDGSSVRIDSDEAFESSSDDGRTWKGVSVRKAPPYPPRLARLRYHNVAVSHSVLGGGPAQPRVNAGEKVTLVYTLRGPAPQGRFSAKVSLSRDGSCWWDEEVELGPDNVAKQADGLWKLSIPFDAPLYSSGGKFEIGVWCNDICISDGSKMSGELEIMRLSAIPGEETSPAVTVVRQKGGKLGIAIDGKPYPVLWGGLAPRTRPDRLPRFGDAPLTVVSIHGQQYWQWHPRLGVYDFSYLDREAEKYRRANPDAKFIWNFMIFPPGDFAQKYPEDMEADDLGDRTPVGRPCWSFASKRALAELQEIADRVIRHIEASPYGNRTIGYRFSSGVGVEWLGWDAKPGRVKGFSDLNKRAYADYAAKFCPQLADPHVPDLAEREDLDSPTDFLWDQRKHLNAVTYMDYNSAVVVDDLLAVCGQAKDTLKSLGRQKLVGTFYGYCCFINAGGAEQFRGHLAVKKFIDENRGRVDFVCSPQSYHQRYLGDTCGDMKPFASLEDAGVMTFLEDDTRTFNNPYPNWDTYCDACTEKQSVAEVQRNAAIQLCRLMAPYFFALVAGCDYDTPAFDRAFRDIRTAMEFCDARGVTRRAEVALVTSERSIAALPRNLRWIKTGRTSQRYGSDGKVVRRPEHVAIFNGEVFNAINTKFSRAGVGYDYLLAEDLDRFAGDYRLYVFLNLFKYDEGTLRAVRKLRERGATILWLYAPGYLRGNSLADMEELTGIAFEELTGTNLVAGVTMKEDGRFMGTPKECVARLFSPVDADVVLGRYANGKPGVTASKTGKSVSFFSGPWQLDQKFISTVVGKSGVHIYCESGDPVEANDALFTLHARFPGRKTVHLPRKADVVDVFNHRLVARDTDIFSFDANLHDTALFYYGPDAEELLLKLR